jgi:EpsI family protein
MDRRSFLIGSAMGASGIAGMVLQPRPVDAAVLPGTLDALIPTRIGTYRAAGADGLILPPKTPLSEHVYSDMLVRLYADDAGTGVMLLAAAGAATGPGLSVHRPEQCYPAAGFDIPWTGQIPLTQPAPEGANARLVTAVRAQRRELVHYWIRVGNAFPLTSFDQRLALIDQNLQGVVPPARLVRLSVLSRDAQEDQAGYGRIAVFSDALLAGLSQPARLLMLGR